MSKAALGNSNAVYLFTTTKTPTATCAVIPTETPTPTVVNPAASNPNIKVINTKDFLTPDGKLDLTKAMTDNTAVTNQVFDWAFQNMGTIKTVTFNGVLNDGDECVATLDYSYDLPNYKALIHNSKKCVGIDLPLNSVIKITGNSDYYSAVMPLSTYDNSNYDLRIDLSNAMSGFAPFTADLGYSTTLQASNIDIPGVGKGIQYIYSLIHVRS